MKIVFASNNKNKMEEIRNQLPKTIELISLDEIGCYEDIPETAKTIEGNAILKANYISEKYNLPCFADDTGLEIEVLNNDPGVYSARYAGEQKSSEDNMRKVLEKLKKQTNRKARFKTVIALNINNKQYLFTGIVNGTIANEQNGSGGFGYDPIFIPENNNKTFAEMDMDEKGKISHRALAVTQLIDFINKQ